MTIFQSSEPSVNLRKMDGMIYIPFVLGVMYCYADYMVARYHPDTKIMPLSALEEAPNELCSQACASVKTQMCQEWASFSKDFCPTVCSTYLEADAHYGNWTAIFKCVEKASSAQEIQSCGVSCTGPVEL